MVPLAQIGVPEVVALEQQGFVERLRQCVGTTVAEVQVCPVAAAASAFGADAYETLDTKISALIEGINRSHPLIDGNKRLSWVAAVIFARLNGHSLVADPAEINKTIRAVAEGHLTLDVLRIWVNKHMRTL